MIQLNSNNIEIFEKATKKSFVELENNIKNFLINPFVLDDTIDHPELNEMGLQVFRWLAYDQRMEEKRAKTKLFQTNYHHDLVEKGYIKLENILNLKELIQAKKQILSLPEIVLRRKSCENLPITLNISNNHLIQDIFRLCQGDNEYSENSLYFRKICHVSPGENSEDARQYNFHVDKFYPNYKVWLYPFHMRKEAGPLSFFEASHKNTVSKMKWVYNRSVNKIDWSRLHYNVDDYAEEAKKLDLGKEVICADNENTMFVVDTRMFHRRTPTNIGSLRTSFRAILKRNNLF